MMRVNYIHPDDYDMAVFGGASQDAIDYVREKLGGFRERVHSVAHDSYRAAMEVFERYSGEETLRRAREVRRRISNVFVDDVIKALTTMEELQSAKPRMIRYNMACPELRTLYHRQECAGYGNDYKDNAPDDIGHEHHDYRMVMNGVFYETEDGYTAVSYYHGHQNAEDEDDLTIGEVDDIRETWNNIRDAIKRGRQDPSSIHGDSL